MPLKPLLFNFTSCTNRSLLLSLVVHKQAAGLLLGMLFIMYRDSREYLYANECGHRQAEQLHCGVHTAVSRCVINANFSACTDDSYTHFYNLLAVTKATLSSELNQRHYVCMRL